MKFKSLVDCCKTLSRNKIKHIELLDFNSSEGNLSQQLFAGLISEQYRTEEDAIEGLYGKVNKNTKENFRQVKRRLWEQVINTSFFIHRNLDSTNRIESQIKNDLHIKMFAAASLAGRGAKSASIDLYIHLLDLAIKVEYLWGVIEILVRLRYIYSREQFNEAAYKKYSGLSEKYEKLYYLDTLTRAAYEKMLIYYQSGRANPLELIRQTSVDYPLLLSHVAPDSTARFLFYTYSLGVSHYFAINDCRMVVEICDTAIQRIEQHPNCDESFLVAFGINRLLALTLLREVDETIINTNLKYCHSLTMNRSPNWFTIAFMEVHLYLFIQQYGKAYALFKEIINEPAFTNLYHSFKESAKLYEGYFVLLAKMGQIDPKLSALMVSEFKVKRFKNEFTNYTNDKKGMNIPVMLLPVLIDLVEGRSLDYNHSAEAINKYAERYFKRGEQRRSYSFIKMLLALSELDTKAGYASKRIRHHLNNLNTKLVDLSGRNFNVEIIPYDHLWPMMMEHLRSSTGHKINI
jgi:hypothetical protein